jgi:23S rRNA (cytidine2498-2'-O)-methyltransferase
VARLAAFGQPYGAGRVRGLFVYFVDFQRAFVAREAGFGGQRRMADDPLAPSRSYLKIEEACALSGRAPTAGETVVDLGAAPGGWSYSAAKRGAKVIAVDNGPLKGGAASHPLIEHRRGDAFTFAPPDGVGYDWLFCDLIEEPHYVLRDLVTPWLERRWCRQYVFNLKFGRVDPLALLQELRAGSSPLVRCAGSFQIRHLYHDREEFTVMGRLQ